MKEGYIVELDKVLENVKYWVREAGGEVITSSIEKLNGEIGVNIIAANPKMSVLLYDRIQSIGRYFE